MSDLLIVLPSEWVELDQPGLSEHLVNNIGQQTLQNMIDDGSWAELTALLEDFWTPPPGLAMTGARVFAEDSLRLFVMLG